MKAPRWIATRNTACLVALGLLLAGCVVESKQWSDAGRAHAIEQLRQEIRNGENAGDASVFGRIAAADVVVMPPNAVPLSGRDAVVAAMRRFCEKFALRIDYTDCVVEIRGDTAIDRGSFAQTITPKNGGPAAESKGSYLWVYRRTADGGWEQTQAIWNLR